MSRGLRRSILSWTWLGLFPPVRGAQGGIRFGISRGFPIQIDRWPEGRASWTARVIEPRVVAV